MTTSFLREKINLLNSLIQQDELQRYQAQLYVKMTTVSTGDQQVDKAIKDNADAQGASILACTRRIETYQGELDALNAELAQTGAKPVASGPTAGLVF